MFANKDAMLFPNQFVNAKMLLNTLQNATLVPTQALQQSGQGPFVYVVGAGWGCEDAPGEAGTGERHRDLR